MSDQDIKTTEIEKSRLGLQVHAIMLSFLNRIDANATIPPSRTGRSKSCMQLLSTKCRRALKHPTIPILELRIRGLLMVSHLDSVSSWTVHLYGQTTVTRLIVIKISFSVYMLCKPPARSGCVGLHQK